MSLLSRVLPSCLIMLAAAGCSLLNSTQQEYAQLSTAFWQADHSPVHRAWARYISRPTPKALCLLPTISVKQKMIVVAAEAGHVRAFQAKNGHQLWQTSLSDHLISGVVIYDHQCFVVSLSGVLYALDERTGYVKHKYVLSLHGFVGQPLFYKSTVLLRGKSGEIEAIDLKTSKQKWHFVPASSSGRDFSDLTTVSALSCGSMVVRDGDLFTLDALGHLWSLDIVTGAPLWHRDSPVSDRSALLPNTIESPVGDLLADHGALCSSFLNGHLRCFSDSSASAEELSEMIPGIGPLRYASGYQTYMLQYNNKVLAASLPMKQTAQQAGQWFRQLDFDDLYTSPVVWHQFVVLGSKNSKLVFLTKDSGAIYYIDSINVGPIYFRPLVLDNTIFLLTGQGWLLAYQLNTNTNK